MIKKINERVKLPWFRLAGVFVVTGFLVLLWRELVGPVFAGNLVLPQQFHVGSLTVHYYGILLAVAVVVARYVAVQRATWYGIAKDQVDNYALFLVATGLVGARLYHVGSEFEYYMANPQFIFAIWQGGLSIYGAVLGGLLGLSLVSWQQTKKTGVGFWLTLSKFANWLTFSLLAGQIIGRLGNWFNYEAFGLPTDLPWKMFVPLQFRPDGFGFEVFFHPWFAYEILANIIIFAILWGWKRHNSALFLWYLLLYNIVRIPLEFLRIDSVFIGEIRQNVVVSLVLAILAGLLIIKFRSWNKSSNTISS